MIPETFACATTAIVNMDAWCHNHANCEANDDLHLSRSTWQGPLDDYHLHSVSEKKSLIWKHHLLATILSVTAAAQETVWSWKN
jgi:hypothetical protein